MQHNHSSTQIFPPTVNESACSNRYAGPWRLLMGATLALLLLSIPGALLAQSDFTDTVIINEIHYNPSVKTEPVEFIELYNPGPVTIRLSGWSIAGAVRYQFPGGAVLEPGGYLIVAQNADRFQQKYGPAAVGSYTGKLSNDGEEVILRDSQGQRVDSVDYGHHFPWPIVGDDPGDSIQLLNPALDNRQPGAWRSAAPTPKAQNSVYANNPPPFIKSVKHQPKQPTSGEPVTVEVSVSDADGLSTVLLQYQVVEPGAYISINDAEYAQQWTNLPMQADGDGRYLIELPGAMQQHRRLIRYRVLVTDGQGNSVITPYADDPQPNFAYFVYDGLPAWSGSVTGDPASAETYDFNQMRPMQVVHLIAKSNEVVEALFMPPAPQETGYGGSDYLWSGTVVYDGDVYDHVGYRARGGFTRYATGKNMWKFNFTRGHRLEARDDYGRKYNELWDKLNLSAVIQQTHRLYRGEQGMFESTTFRLFNLVGTEAPRTQFVQLRVIDEAAETGATQFDGDFWGLYLAIEQMDGRYLKEHDLPDGNLYRMEPGEITLSNQGADQVTDWSDLWGFIDAYLPNPEPNWWRANVDMEKYYGYRAMLEAIHHYDVNQGKNFSYFINPETQLWSQQPWDVDLTWADTMPGDAEEPFGRRVLRWGELDLEYQNRVREVRDLLFNPEHMGYMIDEYASFINSPSDGLAMVDADRAMWDYNPIYGTRYVDPKRTKAGEFYRIAETKGFSRDFAGMLDVMRKWVDDRGAWIDANLINDHDFPGRSDVMYIGLNGFPADQLRFQSSAFTDPQGADTFGGMKWRIAEVTDPTAPAYDPTAPILYEISATYETPELNSATTLFEPPVGSVRPGHAYRVRVRMKDNTGRWGHWSAPMQFIAGAPASALPNAIRVTEIMYHPAPLAGVDRDQFEFIELKNVSNQPIDLSTMYFDDGISYSFDPGVKLEAGGFLTLASDRHAFEERYGFAPFDEYKKLLDNDGEQIILRDAYDRAIITLVYNDAPDWPQGADGEGYSLVLDKVDGDPSLPDTWRASMLVHGSPGAEDPIAVVINEVQPRPSPGAKASVEVYNPTDRDADLSHWLLSNGDPETDDLQFKRNTVVPAGAYRVYTAADFSGQSTRMLNVPETGGTITLISAAADRRHSGYKSAGAIGGYTAGISFGRHVSSDDRVHFVRQNEPTLGRANGAPYVGPVVISKIMYQPVSGDEYLELTNASNQTVQLFDPAHVENSWQLGEVRFRLPSGLELPAGGVLLITQGDAADLCISQPVEPNTQVIGHFPGGLSDDGMTVALSQPGAPTSDGLVPYIAVDTAAYDVTAPWPTEPAGGGAALERSTLTSFGGEPSAWSASFDAAALARVADDGPFLRLCNFEATENNEDGSIEIGWVSAEEVNIAKFNIWRVDGADEVLITPGGVVAQGGQGSARYSVTDAESGVGDTSVYWLEMVGVNGETERVSFTMLRNDPMLIFLPIIEALR